MQQQRHNNYALLGSVKGEIDTTLDSTCKILESYVENPEGDAQLETCSMQLHQVYGALQVLELYGAGKLAAELEALTVALINDEVGNRGDAYEVLMRGLIQLPNYLEFINSGKPDAPIIFLPLLNDLRAARNAKLLSEGALFSPNLNVEAPSSREQPEDSLKALITKNRHSYHLGLLDWFRDNDMQAGLHRISVYISKLRPAANDPDTSRLLWVASGLVEGLLDQGVKPSVAVKMLMGHLDRQFKKIIDHGDLALSVDPPQHLLKNLLYYVASSSSTGHNISELKNAFQLKVLLPDTQTLENARLDLYASNAELIQSVSSVLIENLSEVKIHLDVFIRAHDRDSEVLTKVCGKLAQMGDALDMIGFGNHRSVLQDQIKLLTAMGAGDKEINDQDLSSIADALAAIESELSDPKQRELLKLVVDEIKLDFIKVKDALSEEASWDPENSSALQEVPAILDRARGSLDILALSSGANILSSTSNYFQTKLLTNSERPDDATLDLLADIICSIEYYLELLIENSGQQVKVLNAAEESLKELTAKSKIMLI